MIIQFLHFIYLPNKNTLFMMDVVCVNSSLYKIFEKKI
jgi:hypothetical protein